MSRIAIIFMTHLMLLAFVPANAVDPEVEVEHDPASLLQLPSSLNDGPAHSGDTPTEWLQSEECVAATSLTNRAINSMLGRDDCLRKVGITRYRVHPQDGTTLFYDSDSREYRLPLDELPPSADPNDFHANPLVSDPGLSVAAQSRLLQFLALPIGTQYANALPTTSYALQVRPGVYYDTGAFESTPNRFFPGNIALDNTAAARKRGNAVFNDLEDSLQNIPVRAQLNNTFKGLFASDLLQAYADFFYAGRGDLRGRSYFARGYSGDFGFLIGKAETAFGDLGSAPMLVSHGAVPVGAPGVIDPSTFTHAGINQIRLTRHWDSDTIETTFAIEESFTASDVIANDQDLHDWPAFVSRVRFSPDDFDSYQIAAMYRPIGFISPTFVDRTTDGWGLSFIGRRANSERTRAIYCGAVGGEGIGGYIFGGVDAAVVTSPEQINALTNYGGYVAFQQVLSRSDELSNLTTNIAYGFVDSDAVMANQNAVLQQAWWNLLWNATDSVALGIEYQYGYRKIQDGNSGDNHRFSFIAQFTTPSARSTAAVLKSTRSPNQTLVRNRRL
ncbi:hypothetical protein Mal15_58030 [Stieleria maiorica]|uniref:Porin subfamily protein n=1 Tax=Stieleria maiorica TaxID=2795974 RepID=A0A5B9ML95_9BACT|nr:hypothetical protein [Stieleria maiorica]QEG01724.1 hypothetical protein Mal15_58030 [Stieleria maiorica]